MRAEHGRLFGARFDAIRKILRGEGLDLDRKQAVALAGDWYNWFIARYEDDPGDPATIEHAVWDIIEAMREFAPDEGGHAGRYLVCPELIGPNSPVRET